MIRPAFYHVACLLFATIIAAETPTPVAPTTTTQLTLSDFDNGKSGSAGSGWSTEADGAIHLKGKGGNLISKESYEDFILEWEWKISEKGNNGVKYWVAECGKDGWLGLEYQMIDDTGHPDAKNGPKRVTAALYDIKPVSAQRPTKPAGEWNSSKVISKGGKLEHWLNGVLMVSVDTKSPEWPTLIAGSKFKGKTGFAPGKGRLMLTDHNDETWYRNLRIQRL